MNEKRANDAAANFGAGVGNVAIELCDAGVPIGTVVAAILPAVERLAMGAKSTQPIIAMLRLQAGRIEALRKPLPAVDGGEGELIELTRRAHEFVDTLQVAGIDERGAVTCITNAMVERVARTAGAAAAATWLRKLADLADLHAAEIDAIAQSH